jgi:uncharacterized protein YheU (UPF0270 family)
MNNEEDVTVEYDRHDGHAEEGIVVPHDRINPDTLRKMVEEFVTREWSEMADAGCTLDEKIEQVVRQLEDGVVKVVFDLTSETCNIIPLDRMNNTR